MAVTFVRLKLRILRNSLSGQTMRLVGFLLGLVSALLFAFAAAAGLSASALASEDVGLLVAVSAGSLLVLGWTLAPLLFFGVDETLDPARFALLPIPRRALVRGMLASAFVGVAPIASLLGSMGLVIAAGIRFGPVGALMGLAGVAAGLAVGVAASRAMTSAFANLLRSRRMRDIAAVVLSLLASSILPLQWIVTAAVRNGSLDQAVRIARGLAWTPFGAAYAVPYDAAAGRWDLVGARAAVVAGTVVLLLWWWSRTLESAMYASGSGGVARSRATQGGAVSGLMPAWLRRLGRPGPYVAIVAREYRLWWREGRRRPVLITIIVTSAVLPLALTFADASPDPGLATGGFVFAGFALSMTMVGTMTGAMLSNQFGFDGSAFAAHLLVRVSGAVDLRARAAALAVRVVPLQVLVAIAVSAVKGGIAHVPAGLGVLAASTGVGLGAAAVVSVLAPYALPQSDNPFAINAGSGSIKGMLAMVALGVTLVLSAPVTVAAILLDSAAWGWPILLAGLAYGLAGLRLGTSVAGRLLDRRGPEILTAVTPRR